jgi:hypothetical protein
MTSLELVQSTMSLQAAELEALGVEVPQVEHHQRALRPEEESLERQHVIATYSKDVHDCRLWSAQDPVLAVRHFHILLRYIAHFRQTFMPTLLAHVYRRLRPEMHDPSTIDISHVRLKDDRLRFHVTARFNYTTYDLRREQDYINVKTNKNFILVSTPGAFPHPWRYARVLKIMHVDGHVDPDSVKSAIRINVLWVRWLETDPDAVFGASVLRPERLRWCNGDFANRFGFVDPSTVIRAAPIEPALDHGVITSPPSPLKYRDTEEGDYKYHYVAR